MSAPTPQSRSLSCPNCGGGVTLRGFSHTLSAVCIQCLTILDTSTPEVKILQQFQAKERIQPLIPLGVRGKLHGDPYEVIGFQAREIQVSGIPYEWREYLLFNPYKGFRYLSEYDGHWNDIKTLKQVPETTQASGKRAVRLLGETYVHFQTATATTTYVMGEFPWRVRVGEQAVAEDFISPPRMLSSERITGQAEEITWSHGEYITGDRIWQVFQLQGKPPAAKGIFANQPSPHLGKVASIWQMCLFLLIGLFAIAVVFAITSRNEQVFKQKYTFSAGATSDSSFVTPLFELQGRPSNVELSIRTDLDNESAYFSLALINESSGQAYDFGREVSYYYGRDSDGNWSEGGRNDSVTIPAVPPGRYYLRVEPEMGDETAPALMRAKRMNYELILRRDVPSFLVIWLALPLLLVPPIIVSIRRQAFETRRWQESDYGGKDSDDSGDDE